MWASEIDFFILQFRRLTSHGSISSENVISIILLHQCYINLDRITNSPLTKLKYGNRPWKEKDTINKSSPATLR